VSERLPPRAQIAVGLIVAGDGRMLLQLRDARPGLPDAGRWGFFGGHIEPGEQPEEAFLREMQEELTWRPRHFEHYRTRDVDTDAWHATSHAFAAHLAVPLEQLEQREGQDLALFEPHALPENATEGIAAFVADFAGSRMYKRMQRDWPQLTATALLIDRQGHFLLQHRDDKLGIANPGKWGSFGGEIEPYETPEHGFLREMQEELAWQPARYHLLNAYPFEEGGTAVLVYVYAALVDVPESALVLGEGQGMGFFAPDALPDDTVPALRALIEWWARQESFRTIRNGI
jgi:mutator protein MutT